MRTMTEQFNAALKWKLAWALQPTPHTLGESLQALYTCGKCPRFASQGTTEVYGYFKQWKLSFCSSEILSIVSQLTSQHRCQVAGIHLHDLRPGHGEGWGDAHGLQSSIGRPL